MVFRDVYISNVDSIWDILGLSGKAFNQDLTTWITIERGLQENYTMKKAPIT